METLDDPLGEIPALDAEPELDVVGNAVLSADLRPRRRDIWQAGELARRPFDRNRIRHHTTDVTLISRRHLFMVDLALKVAIGRRKEVLAVVTRVKTEDVGTQHVLEDLALPRG